MDGVRLPAISVAGRLAFWYSIFIIHAVDKVQASQPAMSSFSCSCSSSFTVEHELLLAYYLVWMLGFLAMLVPPLMVNSPRLMRLAARAMNSLFPLFNPLPPIRLMDWLRFGPQFVSFLGFFVTARYSFLIIHAVDHMQASPPAMSSCSFTVEHELLLEHYRVWMLGFLTMLLASSPPLMRLAARAINSLFPVFTD